MFGRGPIRQSQLITPFGPGALHTDRHGATLICCGLDYWFEGGSTDTIQEFIIDDEWRLERNLGTHHFRKPPDFRRPAAGYDIPNAGKTIPFLRFPTWHYCIECGYMRRVPLTYQGLPNQNNCMKCQGEKDRKVPVVQVRFVIVCEYGHIQDFPWNEWAHRSVSPECDGSKLQLRDYRGTLESIIVACTQCDKSNNMAGIAFDNLNIGGKPFNCRGQRLWLHDEEGDGCGLPVRASLRNASNLYYAKVASSIFIPRDRIKSEKDNPMLADLTYVLNRPGINELIDTLLNLSVDSHVIIGQLRDRYNLDFLEYSDNSIKEALKCYIKARTSAKPESEIKSSTAGSDLFLYEEYQMLKQETDDPALMTQKMSLNSYSINTADFFSCIMLVHKLRETRVFTGFTRINSESSQTLSERQHNLWLNPPRKKDSWLPACKVFGEGIFFELDCKALATWLEGPHRDFITARIARMRENFNAATKDMPNFTPRHAIQPDFVLIHTLAHLLINQLTYECGYSSASLRERLYFSTGSETPMAGFLIYTAAGDSEGTMGGLVRMGKPGLLEPLLFQALNKAQWCSTDPVCMELGAHGGQGNFSCNLAACHNCALVPETSCEEFNRFLDRGVVTGTVGNREAGFFHKLLKN